MTDFRTMRAAVIGTGFIGTVHVGALRRLGVQVAGVLGSSTERGAEGAKAMGVERSYSSLGELLDDTSVAVVHVTSPNHLHYEQVKAILAAGKHVICEKPLALNAGQSGEMVALAAASGLIAAVCYNIRFYPLNQHAHGMVKAGDLGDVRFITGHYHQDWLARPSDWNWRLEPDQGGALRSVGDIGTHWIDLVSFVSGQKVTAVFADLTTFIPTREKPAGPVATFAEAQGSTQTCTIETDDAAMIMLRFDGGAKAVMSTSQINMGRKNALCWDIAGSDASAAWNSEKPDHLFIGHRGKPNQVLQRDATLMNATGAAAARLPGGHVEGFADSFCALFGQVYGDVAAGSQRPQATYASFEEGHQEMLVCDAVLASATHGCWVDV